MCLLRKMCRKGIEMDKITIMVVDDSPFASKQIQDVVEENGYEAKGIVPEGPVAQTPSSEDVHDDISMEANKQAKPVQNRQQEELIPEENFEELEQEFHIDETAATASQEDVPAVKENGEEFVISDKDLSDFADMLGFM